METHAICHIEWSSTDLERAKVFFSRLFGWKFQTLGENYLIFNPPQGPGVGIMKVAAVRPGESPYVYIEVDEIEPYLQRARELGSEVAVGKTEIPNVGWFAHLKDLDGNVVGLFQAGEASK